MAGSAHLAEHFWSEESSDEQGRARIRARIGGLHCSLCTGTIESALGKRPGVKKVAVSLTHEQALVEYDPTVARPEEFLQTLRDIGYTISDPRRLRPFEEEEQDLLREGRRLVVAIAFSLVAIGLITDVAGVWATIVPAVVYATLVTLLFLVLRRSNGLAVASAGAAGVSTLSVGLVLLRRQAQLAATAWIVAGLAVVLVFWVGKHILKMAAQALRRGILNQHVLLEIGAFAGLVGGTTGLILRPTGYPTAPFFAVSVMVLTYHIFSEWLSLIVKTRSSQAVKRLLDLQPETAHVLRDGEEREVAVEEVTVGDLVRIRPGERVPVDGEVIEGHSAVDQSLVSGEPMPVERLAGSSVVSGSINGSGALLIRATGVGEGSFLQRVIRHVEDARALKPGLLHLVDRVLRVYTPAVLVIAGLATAGWLVGPLLITEHVELQRAIFAGLSVLVMGYPCAVGISAPLSIVRGAGEAAEQGILMRTGEAFQAFRSVSHIVLDKTGTLTEGRPAIRGIEAIGLGQNGLLALAAAAEASSEHPLAQAVVKAAIDRGLSWPDAEGFEALPGQGVVGTINGKEVLAGSPTFLSERGIDLREIGRGIAQSEDAGQTVIAVARGKKALGFVSLGDRLRPDAAATVAELREAGVKAVMLTGDNERAARHTASKAGIDEIYAGVRPGEKADIVRRLQEKGSVAMVGDGINDAPALMQANVGVAMASGTDIAIESADIIIVGSNLRSIVAAREISRRSYRKMIQNLTLALVFNGIGIPVAATGLVYPVWAMVAMASSVTAIFCNSLAGRSHLFFDAVLSVGRPLQQAQTH